MDIIRITAQWQGFNGAPGYSNFHFAGGGGLIGDHNQVANRVRDAFFLLRDILPNDVTIRIAPEAEVIDSDTGMVTDILALDAIDPVVGFSTGGYSGATGAVVNWRTNDLRNGRRIRGRTFLVPLAGAIYDTDGTLEQDALDDVQAFANALVGGDFDSELGVWSRPVNGSGGVFATVVSASVPDLAAVLRSRRD